MTNIKGDGKNRLIIIGAGFGGLNLAKNLINESIDIVLIDKTNFHLFQPLLYQVATSALSPGDIAYPIRSVLNKANNIQIIMGEVTRIDKENKSVYLGDQLYDFDFLVIACGARHSYFGKNNWERYAPGLKTLRDAIKIRERSLYSLEKAENLPMGRERSKLLTFVIIGGGPTGVEMAGSIAEITCKAVASDFKNIKISDLKIILVEGGNSLISSFDVNLSEYAKKSLLSRGVKVLLKTYVTDININGVELGNEFIETQNIIWAAGNEASPLLKTLGTELDKIGRVIVETDCSIKKYPHIFVIGDAALFKSKDGKVLPGVAPVAIQQAEYLSKLLVKNVPIQKRTQFRYIDKGNLATIGTFSAVLQIGSFKLKGFFAWIIWSLIHIASLINFRERYKVMTEWIWYYLTFRQGVRIITKNPEELE